MEYIEGRPLQGPIPLEQALKYASQICDALDAAHKKGIVHRDLKPGNILVTKSGVKLLDFGLAKMPADGDAAPTAPVTQDGMLIGTLPYMSPEQLEGKKADARSDIYSFGLVLHEMLTGQRPLPHQEFQSLEPLALERVIKTCLTKDPDARWQSAHDVKVGLEWSCETQTKAGIGDTPKRSLQRRRVAALLASILLAISLGFAASYWTRPASTGAREVVRFPVNPPDKTTFSTFGNATVPVAQFALSPDGRAIVLAAAAVGSRPSLWLRRLEDAMARPLPGTEDAQNPFWAPDSLWIGFFAEGTLKKIPLTGGTAQEIAGNVADPRGGSWGLDDTILFADGTSAIFRISSGGGTVAPVTQLDLERREGTHRWPYFLPGGQHFLYTIRSGIAEHNGIFAGSLDAQDSREPC